MRFSSSSSSSSSSFRSLLLSLFLVFLHLPTHLSSDLYKTCRNQFRCGTFSAGYPFWGSDDRPEDCGHPDLKLQCDENDNTTLLQMGNVSYLLLRANLDVRTFQIARKDYMDGFCSPNLTNTTLDPTLFDVVSSYKNGTFYYGCVNLPDNFGMGSRFNCGSTGLGSGFVYGGVSDPLGISECNYSVTVPVYESLFSDNNQVSNLTVLESALKSGFELTWKFDYDECDRECVPSGGTCGFLDGNPTCYCVDPPYFERNGCPSPSPSSIEPDDGQCSGCQKVGGQCGNVDGKFVCYCPDNNPACDELQRSLPVAGHKKKKSALIVGLSIAGAVIAGLVVGILLIRQRRKKMAAQSKSRDLLKASSGEGTFTTTTNYSRSVPSYLSSSISDLEKGASNYFGVQVFTYAELEEATQNFDSTKELGDGGFGTVYYGVLKDGRAVAVKRLYENHLKRVEQFMNEVEILKRLRHPNLVILFGCTSRRSRELLLVYEYISNGTVADHLHGNRAQSGLLTWPIRLKIAVETASALSYLHIKDVIHRDVKTNNILLDKYFNVKVADFGLSRLFPTDVTHISTAPQGTPGYVDPEYYQCYQLTGKSDVYSFGVVLVELISSKEAVDITRHRHDINLANMAVTRIQNQALHEIVDPTIGFETDLVTRRKITLVAELAFRCLQQDRDMRPSMSEVLEILRGIENDGFDVRKPDVVDIGDDDVGLLRSIPPPLSPDSIVPDHSNWASSSSTINSG